MTESEKKVDEPTTNLIAVEEYLKSGIHLGSQFKTHDMRPYLYRIRQDGLHVLDIKTVDDRLNVCASFLASYEPDEILVVANRVYARKPAKKMADGIGAKSVIGRFVPGTLTNPNCTVFYEPKLIFVSDPSVDMQVIREAAIAKIPVVALCDTNNVLKGVDFVVPLNNKGKKSLALAYWLLTKEILKRRGVIKADDEFKEKPEDFETTRQLEEEQEKGSQDDE